MLAYTSKIYIQREDRVDILAGLSLFKNYRDTWSNFELWTSKVPIRMALTSFVGVRTNDWAIMCITGRCQASGRGGRGMEEMPFQNESLALCSEIRLKYLK